MHPKGYRGTRTAAAGGTSEHSIEVTTEQPCPECGKPQEQRSFAALQGHPYWVTRDCRDGHTLRYKWQEGPRLDEVAAELGEKWTKTLYNGVLLQLEAPGEPTVILLRHLEADTLLKAVVHQRVDVLGELEDLEAWLWHDDIRRHGPGAKAIMDAWQQPEVPVLSELAQVTHRLLADETVPQKPYELSWAATCWQFRGEWCLEAARRILA